MRRKEEEEGVKIRGREEVSSFRWNLKGEGGGEGGREGRKGGCTVLKATRTRNSHLFASLPVCVFYVVFVLCLCVCCARVPS